MIEELLQDEAVDRRKSGSQKRSILLKLRILKGIVKHLENMT